jgi:hypothetical protein
MNVQKINFSCWQFFITKFWNKIYLALSIFSPFNTFIFDINIFASLKQIIDYFVTNSLILVFNYKYCILCFSCFEFKTIFLIIFIVRVLIKCSGEHLFLNEATSQRKIFLEKLSMRPFFFLNIFMSIQCQIINLFEYTG